MDKRKQIFPVSYYQGQVENNDILKEQLLSRINFTKNKVQVPPGWTTTKIITSINSDKVNKFLYDNEELTNQYIDAIESFCDDDYIIEIDEIWFNYYIDGEYQEQHNHIDSAQDQRRKDDKIGMVSYNRYNELTTWINVKQYFLCLTIMGKLRIMID